MVEVRYSLWYLCYHHDWFLGHQTYVYRLIISIITAVQIRGKENKVSETQYF